MSFDPKTLLQILILSVGVHIVLSFVRATRGTGMVRGVLIALFVIFGGLIRLADGLGLAELDFILDALTGFVVVILAIVFQPELRRGIISLGDNPLLRTVIGRSGTDVTDEVAAACVSMAKRNQGALIAFERRVALDAWTQKAVRLDSRVSRHLLDSIFYPGSPLHDGAVIIREDRVAAAQAILPLSEKENLARSIGTRHRAALGLSEETDAIVVAVSEETGLITVCQDGQMERRVLKDELAETLRKRLGGEAESARPAAGGRFARLLGALKGAFVDHLGQKLLALAFGIIVFMGAHGSVRDTRTFDLRVTPVTVDSGRTGLASGSLRIVLPSEDLHLRAPRDGRNLKVRVTAAQADLAKFATGIGAVLAVDPAWVGAERDLSIDDVLFGVDEALEGLEVEWVGGRAPRLHVERYAEAEIRPNLASFVVVPDDGTEPDDPTRTKVVIPGDVELDPASLSLEPRSVRVRGPADEVRAFAEDATRLRFEPVDVTGEDRNAFIARLTLAREPKSSVQLMDDLFLRGELRGRETVVLQTDLDVALVSFEPLTSGVDPTARFEPPTRAVKVWVKARGLIPEDTDESSKVVMRQEILGFVREHARVFVDVGRFDPERGRRVPVEVGSLDALWREHLGTAFGIAKSNPAATLTLEIDEDDRTVALEERDPSDEDDDR